MARVIEFKVHGRAFVRIDLLKRVYPKSKSPGHVNLLEAVLEVVVGEFRMEIESHVTAQEIGRFHTRLTHLYDVLEGQPLLCVQPYGIAVSVDDLGHILVECRTVDASEENSVIARLLMDQTYLPPVIRQLSEAVSKFPAKGCASEASFNDVYEKQNMRPNLRKWFYRIYREVARRPTNLEYLRVALKGLLTVLRTPEAQTLSHYGQAIAFFQGHTDLWESDWTHLPEEYQGVFADFENALMREMELRAAPEQAPSLDELMERVRKLRTVDWEPYDPHWLVQIAREQLPEERWLPAALSICTICQRKSETRVEFINGSGLKKTGGTQPPNGNLILSHPSGGELRLDVRNKTISGIELPTVLGASSQESP